MIGLLLVIAILLLLLLIVVCALFQTMRKIQDLQSGMEKIGQIADMAIQVIDHQLLLPAPAPANQVVVNMTAAQGEAEFRHDQYLQYVASDDGMQG